MIRVLAILAMVLIPSASARTGPTRSAQWITRPTVRVCPTLDAPMQEVRAAVIEWARRCHDIGPIVRDRCAVHRRNSVYIMGREPLAVGGGTLGHTRYTAPGGIMIAAAVSVRTGLVPKTRRATIEHEMGHALGWVDDPSTPDVDEAHTPPGTVLAPALDVWGPSDAAVDLCGD